MLRACLPAWWEGTDVPVAARRTALIKAPLPRPQTREATFREISESTNVRVLWWSIGQAFVLVMTGFMQLRHLKGFFEQKKLV